VFGILLRLLPHTPNFTAVGAIALFAGAVYGGRLMFGVPLAIMAASDAVIGFYPGMVYTWLGFMLVAWFGVVFRRTSLRSTVLLGGLGGSVIFFVVSNFGVWQAGGLYAPTLAGLVRCFVMGIPFFGATLASSVFYGALLFGLRAAAGSTARLAGAEGRVKSNDSTSMIEYTYV
jgi:hypothetical protein